MLDKIFRNNLGRNCTKTYLKLLHCKMVTLYASNWYVLFQSTIVSIEQCNHGTISFTPISAHVPSSLSSHVNTFSASRLKKKVPEESVRRYADRILPDRRFSLDYSSGDADVQHRFPLKSVHRYRIHGDPSESPTSRLPPLIKATKK